jgi:tetratricopeptide (TPR) repeat protein
LGLAFFFEKMTRSFNSWVYIVFAGLCLWYGWATFQRNNAWRTDESFWRKTIQDAPESPRAWNGMGSILLSEKKYDGAIHFFRKALALNSLLVDARHNIATCYLLQKKYAQAKEEYLEVLRESPFDANAMFQLAYLYDKEHDFPSAARYYGMTLKSNPLDRGSQRNLALLHCRAGHVKLCREELDAYLREAPPDERNEDIRTFIKNLPVN